MSEAPTAAPPTTRPRRPYGAAFLAVIALILGVVIGAASAGGSKTPSSCKSALNTADSLFTSVGQALSSGTVKPSLTAEITSKTASYQRDRDACEKH